MKIIEYNWYENPQLDRVLRFIERHASLLFTLQLIALIFVLAMIMNLTPAWADSVRLPGEDISAQMEGAGTLLRFVDTAIFSWVARLLCGLCVGGAAWSLKEARFGSAVIAIVSALLFGTAPTWVKNIFSISGANSVFSQTAPIDRNHTIALETPIKRQIARHAIPYNREVSPNA